MLCGYPPFYNSNQRELFKTIKKGKYEFDSPHWDPITKEAKDLVSKCLTVDTSKRITMKEILQHPWVVNAIKSPNIIDTKKLKVYNAKRKLKSAILSAIAANKLLDILEQLKI